MGERLLCKQEVIGSIPFTSTTEATKLPRARQRRACAARARRSIGNDEFAGGVVVGLIFEG